VQKVEAHPAAQEATRTRWGNHEGSRRQGTRISAEDNIAEVGTLQVARRRAVPVNRHARWMRDRDDRTAVSCRPTIDGGNIDQHIQTFM
jgi:hypothetical protein